MITVRKLLEKLKEMDPSMLDAPVRVVSRIREVEKGPREGALVIQNKDATGAALCHGGLFIFSEEDSEGQENYVEGLPGGFCTGNKEIDNRLKGFESGDEWKMGE